MPLLTDNGPGGKVFAKHNIMQRRRGYRVIRHDQRVYRYAIHEVVYDGNDQFLSVSDEPAPLAGMSVQEIIDTLEMITDEVDRPAIDFHYFPEIEKESI